MTTDQEKKLNEIHLALVGSKEYQQKGLIEKVNELEKFKEKQRMRDAKIAGAATVAAISGHGLFAWIKSLFL